MRKIFLSIPFLIFIKCNNAPKENSNQIESQEKLHYLDDCKRLLSKATELDSILFTQMDLDTVSAQRAIIAFTEFANFCESDTLAPIFLVKTAQVAKAINNIPQCKVVLDKCVNDYPYFKERAAALFLLAQLYDEDNYMNDENEAKKLYQKIIDDFPKSVWAQNAKGAIAFLGKSDKEITKIFIDAYQKK